MIKHDHPPDRPSQFLVVPDTQYIHNTTNFKLKLKPPSLFGVLIVISILDTVIVVITIFAIIVVRQQCTSKHHSNKLCGV